MSKTAKFGKKKTQGILGVNKEWKPNFFYIDQQSSWIKMCISSKIFGLSKAIKHVIWMF
jgi:hypothetical protein